MSFFEYQMVMVSLILGLSITQLLRGMARLVRGSDFPAIMIWTIALFVVHVQVWWALWDFNTVAAWTQPKFFLLVSLPCLLFGATELLLPLGMSAETDWRKHYFRVRVWFLGVFAAFVAIAIFVTKALMGASLIHPYRLFQLAEFLLLVAGIFSVNERVHYRLAWAWLLTFIAGQLIFRLLPAGAFS